MDKNVNVTIPRYQKIAIDLAKQIAKGKYKVGEKIYSRTSLASQYNVSHETARRAVAVLADLEIVETAKGSGVIILSPEKARNFIANYTTEYSIGQIKSEIMEHLRLQQKHVQELEHAVLNLLDKTNNYRGGNPLIPVEIPIKDSSLYLGKTISEINFWHNTGATVVAIQRGSELLLSPGPYACLNEGDILLVIGDYGIYENVNKFLYSES